ncbi:MAG TPA: Tad domain-containing protein [Alphaproteobacteria bacterium]|nr:Tad domain-containing protein [Alphaproteobacteria bacterium]
MKCMKLSKLVSEQRGGVAIMVAVCAVVLLSFAALVIDMGYGWVVKNQLHNVADAGALAGTSCLGIIYTGGSRPLCGTYPEMSPEAQQSYMLTPEHRAAIIAEVQDAALKNAAGGVSISISEADIRIGQWEVESRTLTVTDERPTAVEVTARRDGTANGPISTFLGNIMGMSSLNVRATSVRNGQPEEPTAALTGVAYVPPGELDIPVALSQSRFAGGEDAFCGDVIKFSPPTDPDACGGWTLLTTESPNDKDVRDLLGELLADPASAPELGVGDPIYVKNGVLSKPTFTAMEDLYNARKDAAGTWKTFVPVYNNDVCNPNATYQVKGFATVLITKVKGPPDNEITGTILCDVVEPARGGGAEFGTIGSIPGLVK